MTSVFGPLRVGLLRSLLGRCCLSAGVLFRSVEGENHYRGIMNRHSYLGVESCFFQIGGRREIFQDVAQAITHSFAIQESLPDS